MEDFNDPSEQKFISFGQKDKKSRPEKTEKEYCSYVANISLLLYFIMSSEMEKQY